MIDLASYINHFMPRYVVTRVEERLKKTGICLSKAGVLILGVTYKKDVKDLRESPALDIIEELKRKKAKVDYFDPFIPYLKINSLNMKRISLTREKIRSYDCIVLVTGHSSVNYGFIRRNAKFIFDTRNIYGEDFGNVERL